MPCRVEATAPTSGASSTSLPSASASHCASSPAAWASGPRPAAMAATCGSCAPMSGSMPRSATRRCPRGCRSEMTASTKVACTFVCQQLVAWATGLACRQMRCAVPLSAGCDPPEPGTLHMGLPPARPGARQNTVHRCPSPGQPADDKECLWFSFAGQQSMPAHFRTAGR